MKIIKKLIYSILLTITILFIYMVQVKAATVTVTTDTLNLREKASTSSNIVATLSSGVKCELLEEEKDWYKVKYKTYTGYVSKEYVKKNEDSSQDKDTEKNNTTTQKDNNTDVKDDQDKNDVGKQDDTSIGTENGLTIGKISSKVDVKIVPLIYSSKIGELAKNKEVMILSELNGWAYIQTDMITGWIRSDSIIDKKTNSIDNGVTDTKPQENDVVSNENNQASNDNQDAQNSKDDEKEITEKVMYVNESSVNVRTEPNTSSKIMMVLALNTKLTVIGESGDWYKVKTSEGNGYVSKDLLSDKQVTSSRGGSLTNHSSAVSKNNNNISTEETIAESNKNTSKGQEVVTYAKQFLGVPYVYGGASKSGFDCSGFTMYVYKKFGISMRHGAQSQSKIGTAVKADKKSANSLKKNLKPGDLVFFLDYETMDEIGHCGIYIGNGNFIHASSGSGYCVKINSLLPGEYYNTRYYSARRVL